MSGLWRYGDRAVACPCKKTTDGKLVENDGNFHHAREMGISVISIASYALGKGFRTNSDTRTA